MVDKKTSQDKLADLTKQAQAAGALLANIGQTLQRSPSILAFPGQSVNSRFNAQWLREGKIPTDAEMRTLVEDIRAEQLKVWEYEEALRNFGF
jgi:hypothetical protein